MIFLIIPSNNIAKAVKIADSVHNNLKPICDKKSEITPLAKRLANPKITGSNDKIVALISSLISGCNQIKFAPCSTPKPNSKSKDAIKKLTKLFPTDIIKNEISITILPNKETLILLNFFPILEVK